MLLFDTGKKLEKAFTSEQFDALVEVLESREEKAANKTDLRESELRTQLEIEKLRTELIEKIEKLRTELVEKIETLKHEMLKWYIAMAIAQTGVLAALYTLMR